MSSIPSTLDGFRSTRRHVQSIADAIPDHSHLENVSGYVYAGQFYIETCPNGHLLLPLDGRDERYAPETPETLANFEALLFEFAIESL